MLDPSAPLPLIHFDDIMREPLLPVDWLVRPILAREDRAVWYGSFGSFKSWLMLHLAIHLAAGRDWLGFPISHSLRVLYIDEEMNERTLRRRVKRLGMGAGIEGLGLNTLAMMSRVGVRFTEQGAYRLVSAIKASPFQPEVVIVEALRRVLVGDENHASDVAGFWRNVEPLCRGRTFLLTHHMKKPQGEGQGATRDQASGSTDILAGPDAGFGVKSLGDNQIVVECVKVREGEIIKPFGARFREHGEQGPVEMLAEATPIETKTDRALDLLLDYLAGLESARTADIHAYLESQGVEHRTGERALTRARAEGKVNQVQQGLWALDETFRQAS